MFQTVCDWCKEQLTCGLQRRPHPRLRALKAWEGFVCPARALCDGPEDGVQLVERYLIALESTEDIPGRRGG
jgi:hypothetical protein